MNETPRQVAQLFISRGTCPTDKPPNWASYFTNSSDERKDSPSALRVSRRVLEAACQTCTCMQEVDTLAATTTQTVDAFRAAQSNAAVARMLGERRHTHDRQLGDLCDHLERLGVPPTSLPPQIKSRLSSVPQICEGAHELTLSENAPACRGWAKGGALSPGSVGSGSRRPLSPQDTNTGYTPSSFRSTPGQVCSSPNLRSDNVW